MSDSLSFTQFSEQRIASAPAFDGYAALREPMSDNNVQPIIPSKDVAETLLVAYASQSAYRPTLLEMTMRATLGKSMAPSGFSFLKAERAAFVKHPYTTFEMHYDAFLHLHFTDILCSVDFGDDQASHHVAKTQLTKDYRFFIDANIGLIKAQPEAHQADMLERLASAASVLSKLSLGQSAKILGCNIDLSKVFQNQLLRAFGCSTHQRLVSQFEGLDLNMSVAQSTYEIFSTLEAPPPTSDQQPQLALLESIMSDFKDVRMSYQVYSAICMMMPSVFYAISAHVSRNWPAESIALLSERVKARILLDLIRFSDYSQSAFGDRLTTERSEAEFDFAKASFFRYIDIPVDADFFALMSKFSPSLELAVAFLIEWVQQSRTEQRDKWIYMLNTVSSVCARSNRMDLASELNQVRMSILPKHDAVSA